MTDETPKRGRGRPPLTPAERRVNVPLRLPADLLADIEAALRPGEKITEFLEASARAELTERRVRR